MNTLSLAMIVKNEEANLTRCLNSVRGLVDQIVIVDTGSTDNTVHVAHQNGVAPRQIQWHDDFSAARNESLHLCSGDWVLVLDADETLNRGDHDRIRGTMERPYDLFEHYIRHYYIDGNAAMLGHTPEACVGDEYPFRYDDKAGRLFRNHMGFHYEGRLHEKLVPEEGVRVGWADFVIRHYGKINKAKERGKAQAYLDIARGDYFDDSRSGKKLFNYISHARIAGSWADVGTAIDAYESLGEPIPLSVAIIAGEFAHNKGEYDKALRQYQDVLKASPDNAFALNRTAITLAALGRVDEAKMFLEWALSVAPGFTHSKTVLDEINGRLDGIQQQGESGSIQSPEPQA